MTPRNQDGADSKTKVRFDGRVAVVTGAGRGMGREFALLLAQRGAAVVVNDIRSEDGTGDSAAATVERIRYAGGQAVTNTASVAETDGAMSIVDAAVETFGRVDIVINNAGNRRFGPILELGNDDLDALISVHVRGAWNVTRRAWSHFQRQGYGKVLNVASADGNLIGVPHHSAYGICKAGLVGFTRELAVEGKPDGIAVNALLPGAATPDGMGSIEGKSYVPPIDVSAAVVAPGAGWLVHEDCPATGQVFSCSSGRLARVYTLPAEGWQVAPDSFTLEGIRDHWTEVNSVIAADEMGTVENWNAFRTRIYNEALRGA